MEGKALMMLLVAGVLAALAGFFAGKWLQAQVALARMRGVQGQGFLLVLARPFRSFAEKSLQVRAVQKWARDAQVFCEAKGLSCSETECVSLVLAAMVVAGGGAFLVTWSLFWVLLVALGLVLICGVAVSRFATKRQKALREQTPEVLRALGRCVHAGMTLQQTFAQVGAEIEGHFGQVFSRAASMMETGGSSSDALAYIRSACGVPELGFLAIALDVQHQTGGSLAQVLDATAKTITAKLDLARQLQTQTAQAKLSAEVVTLLPFGLLAVLSLLSPGFMEPLLSGGAGTVILVLAVLLQVGGILMVRRILKEAQ